MQTEQEGQTPLPLSEGANQAIQRAKEAAFMMRQDYYFFPHLLFGLAQADPDDPAKQILDRVWGTGDPRWMRDRIWADYRRSTVPNYPNNASQILSLGGMDTLLDKALELARRDSSNEISTVHLLRSLFTFAHPIKKGSFIYEIGSFAFDIMKIPRELQDPWMQKAIFKRQLDEAFEKAPTDAVRERIVRDVITVLRKRRRG